MRCYACNNDAVGTRARTDGQRDGLSPACKRHADSLGKLWIFTACIYCNGPTRKGSVTMDEHHAHAKCHAEACR